MPGKNDQNFSAASLGKIVCYSARVHGIPELGLYKGRFAALKADITFEQEIPKHRVEIILFVNKVYSMKSSAEIINIDVSLIITANAYVNTSGWGNRYLIV